jgi:hypothetical protein
MASNKFPATCAKCGAGIPARAGRLAGKVGGRWLVECASHAAPVAVAGGCDCGRPRCGGCDDTYDRMKDRALESGYRW